MSNCPPNKRTLHIPLIVAGLLGVATPAGAVDITGTVTLAGSGDPLDGFVVGYEGAAAGQQAVVSEDGSFLIAVPTQSTDLLVRSSTGVFFGRYTPAGARAAIRVEPNGLVYASDTGAPAPGIRVRLVSQADGTPAAGIGEGQQGQVTDKHGLYRFDLAAPGSYRIEVEADGVAFHFPSVLVPPQAGDAVVGADGNVAAPAVPDPEAPRPYWLAFSGAAAPRRNHIPVDRAGALVAIEKTASKTQVAVGDIVTYTVRVQNRSARDFLRGPSSGGVVIRDVLPQAMRLVDGSARAWLKGTTGQAIPITLAPVKGLQVIELLAASSAGAVPFEMQRGDQILVRYQAVVGLEARLHTVLTNRAQATEAGGVALSDVARVDVRVAGDAAFDKSWVRGRVYCDEDGDQWSSSLDPGIYGARVYIDTGRYAVTDEHGRFHLSDVPPGLHVVKVDTDTVPPGSEPITRISRSFHVSPGIPQQVSFGFRCTTVSIGPTRVIPAEKDEPAPPTDRVVITGKLEDLSVAVDGHQVAPAGAAVVLVAEAPKDRPLDAKWSPYRLPAPLTLGLTGPSDAGTWRVWIEVREANGLWRPLVGYGGKGAPPDTLDWDGTGAEGQEMVAVRGALHRVRLVVTDGKGSRWRSAPEHFTVGWGQKGPVDTESVAGKLFDRRGKLTGKAGGAIRKVGKRTKKKGGGEALVMLWSPSGDRASRELARARLMLVATELATRSGLGQKSIGARLETGPERIEIQVFDPPRTDPAAGDPPKVEPVPAQVQVNGVAVRVDEKGRFLHAPPRPEEGGTLVIEMNRAGGAAREVSVALHARPSGDVGGLRASLDEGTLAVAGVPLELAALRARVFYPYARVGLVDGAPERTVEIELRAPPKVASWRLRIAGPTGQDAFVQEGEGAPPARVEWAGAKDLQPGGYVYELEVELEDGTRGTSPKRAIELVAGKTGGELGEVVETFRGPLFTGDHRVEPRFQKKLGQLAKQLAARPAAETWHVEVHDTGRGDAAAARLATGTEAQRVRNLLVLEGLPEGRITASGLGNERPLADAAKAAGRKQNRRVEVRRLPTRDDGPPQSPWGLVVSGKDIDVSGRGVAVARLDAQPGQKVKVEVLGRHGQRMQAEVEVPAPKEVKGPAAEDAPFGVHTLARAIRSGKEGKGPPAPVAAADLRVELPPDKSTLGQPLLPIRGTAPPGVEVSVNGQPVPSPGGRFSLLLPLPNGETTKVTIEGRDARGNVARVERTYSVEGNALFLMALADGSLSQPGTGLDQSVDTARLGDVLLHGRLALYAKARIKGGELIKLVKITAYGDTASKAEYNDFVDQVIDPERSYPIYGDAGTEQTDAQARGTKYGRYYVAVEADRSRLIVGTFRPGQWGVELFRYDRIMEGAQLRLQQAFSPGYETVVEAFANYADRRARRSHATLAGTGGSYYFLPDGEVIEGSDQVRIAIYDRDNGGRIQEVPQIRDVDYRIDYVSGRVTFKHPVPSRVDASFLAGAASVLSGRLALDGHEVRILLDYETRASRDVGDTTWGAYARQTFADMVTVGGGYVQEGRGPGLGPDYEMWGTELRVTPTKTTKIEAELARSTAGNGANLVSMDGGLSYEAVGRDPAATQGGYGVTVRAETDVGELLGREEPFLQLRAGYQRQDGGFVSSHSVTEQGQERGSGEVRWVIDTKSHLALRHDTLRALREDLTLEDSSRVLGQSLTSAQYAHRIGQWTVVGDLLHGLETDDEGESTNRGAAAALVRYAVTPRVALWLEQRFLVGGDELVIRDTGDHFVTGFGVDVKLLSDLSLTLGEQVRWSGEEATVLGLRTQLSENASMYVQQRLLHPRDTNRWVPATVIGSEERWGPGGLGRSYGEYQVGSAVDGAFTRAVLGIGRRFRVLDGLNADVAFERSHTEGNTGPAGLTRAARDTNTLSLGAEYVGHESFKLATRFELRFDQAEHERLQLVSFNRLTGDIGGGFSILGRADMAVTQNQDIDKREAETVSLVLGLAYRPPSDTFTFLLKAARIVDMRPVLDAADGSLRTTADVVAVEPIIELPWRFQITPKLAYRHALEEAESLPDVESHTLLAALRLAFHLWETLDLAGEYRMMYLDLAEQIEHGALAEVAVNIARYVRIGAGYNFSDFTDDLFDVTGRSSHGFFVRLSGMY